MTRYHDDEPVTAETIAANLRHDAERHSICMDPKVRWRARRVETAVGSRLTDRRIRFYEERGWYSEAFREARRELWKNKAAKRAKREGNFLIVNGRQIYSPL